MTNHKTRARIRQIPRSAAHFLVSLAVTSVLLYAVFHEQKPEHFVALLQGVRKEALLLYLLIFLTALLARALRYKIVLADTGSAPSSLQLGIVTGLRNALVDLLPARIGELVFFYVLHRYHIPFLNSLTTFGVCFALDLIVLFFIVCLFFLAAPLFLAADSSLLAFLQSAGIKGDPAFTALVFLLVVALLAFAFMKLDAILRLAVRVLRTRFAVPRLARVAAAVEKLAGQLASLKEHGRYLPLILLTFVLRLTKYGALYLLLAAAVEQFGIRWFQINPLLAAVAFIAAEASASLPVSGLMGFGLYEGVWTVIFSLSGVQVPSLVSVILLVHLITQAVSYSVGFLSLLAFWLSPTSAVVAPPCNKPVHHASV